jgi:hypothetical protein
MSVLYCSWLTSSATTAKYIALFIPLGLDGKESWNSVVSLVNRLQAGRLEAGLWSWYTKLLNPTLQFLKL